MKKLLPSLLFAASLPAFDNLYAVPVSVAGDDFILVATNGSGIQLYELAEDDQDYVYAGNNSNGPGIPLQRFRPSTYSNSPVQLENFGPTCDDGDGLSFANGYLYAASLQGVRRISETNGSGTLYLPGVAANSTGSPLVARASDGHLFVGLGYGEGPGIQEYDAGGVLVTNHPTADAVETMTFNPATGIIYYAPFGSNVYSLNPSNDSNSLIASISGTIDGALAYDAISQRLFVGTANGANQGFVYTINLTSGSVAAFASGFQGSLGVLREQMSGDLYFLEDHNLYRLSSSGVTNALTPTLSIWTAVELGWPSDTNQTYQVQWSTALNSNTWYNLGSPIQGNGTTNYVFDSTLNSPQKFYRLVLVP